MKLVGLMHVRNEQWILRLSIPAAMRLVDELVVLDHASTDSTPEIIGEMSRRYPGRVAHGAWEGRHYNETAIRQRLLEIGRTRGGTHLFMIDADEVLTANLIDPVRAQIRELGPSEGLELPWLAMWASPDEYRDDESVWSNNTKLFAFADGPEIGFRALRDGYDMHLQRPRGLREPVRRPITDQREGGVMHLQFANRRRLIAKHAWYKMSEIVRFPDRESAAAIDAKYNQALDEQGIGLSEVGPEWWSLYRAERELVDYDDAPWHEGEVARFWIEHGAEAFRGLELWGLPQAVFGDAIGSGQ